MTLANDKTLAAANNAPARLAELGKIEAAQGAAVGALLLGPAMTIRFGLTSPDEVAKGWPSCNNPKVYASYFNRGHKASQIIGEKLALQVIEDGKKKPGAVFDVVCRSFKLVMDEGDKRAKNGDKSMIKPAAAAKLVSASLSAAGRAMAKAKADKAAGRGNGNKGKGKGDKADGALKVSVVGATAQWIADYVALMARGAKLEAPEGRETAFANGMNDARKANENFGLCLTVKAGK